MLRMEKGADFTTNCTLAKNGRLSKTRTNLKDLGSNIRGGKIDIMHTE